MLVLSRRPGESIKIGEDTSVIVQRLQGGRVVLAIEAPQGVRVVRTELLPPEQQQPKHPPREQRRRSA